MLSVHKIFRFECAHALYNYDGDCAHIHGHSYKLVIGVTGQICQQPESSRDGMIMDFGELKQIVNPLIKKFDHAIVLNQLDPRCQALQTTEEKLVALPFQPTAENLAEYFVSTLQEGLPQAISLKELTLHETESCFVRWTSPNN